MFNLIPTKKDELIPFTALGAIFLIFPFYYQSNFGGVGLLIPSNISVWIGVSLFIWLSFFNLQKNKSIFIPEYFLIIIAFPLLATLSGFVGNVSDPIDWAFRLAFVWGGVFFMLALFQHKYHRRQKDLLLFILVLAGLMHALVGLLQIYQPEGTSFFLPNVNGQAIGMFQQINVQSSYQATAVLIAWYLINRPIAHSYRLTKITIALETFLGTFLILGSGSRVGAFSLFIGLVLVLTICWPVIKKQKKNMVFLLSLMLLAAILSILTDGFERLVHKTETIHTEYSVKERVGIYRISGELIEQKPLFGHGLGSFESVWQYQKAAYQAASPSHTQSDQYISHPHNELIFWQVEGGIMATSGILITFFSILVIAWRSKARYAIALLFPMAFHNQIELPFYLSAISWFTCLSLIYIALSHTPIKECRVSLSSTMSLTLRWGLHITFFMTVIFGVHSLRCNHELKLATESGEHSDLSVPLMNPYFTKVAEDFRMQQIFTQASIERNVDAMRFFNSWQEAAINERPTDHNFKMLIASYQNLQMYDKACQTAVTASHMYRKNDEFRHYVSFCRN